MERAQKLFKEVSGVPERALSLVSFGGLVVLAVSIALFVLFLAHQLTLWLSLDPETAFHRSRFLLSIYASGWNTAASLWNAGVEVMLIATPAWNAGAEYFIKPLVFTSLDVLSLAFTRRPYEGVISESDVPYEGHYCPPDGSRDRSSGWCGKVAYYSTELGYVAGSSSSVVSNSTIVLSTATARRLSELAGEPIVGTLRLDPLVDALQALLGSAIVLLGTLSDVVFHVAWTVLSELFELLFNLFMILVKALASTVMMLIRSGMLQTILSFGIDLLVVVVTEVMVPYFLALVNAVMCVVNYTQVATWGPQMLCIQAVCFQEGGDVFADIFHTFTSIPLIAQTIQRVFSVLVNRNTGQSYSSSSSEKVDVPDIDAGAAATPQSMACSDCFVCKVPEMRAIFMLVGTIYGCVLDGTKYSGRIEAACLTNGTGYLQMCGPRGSFTDLLADEQWRASYTMHRDFDNKLFQRHAAALERLAGEQGGPGNDGFTAHRLSLMWFNRDIGLGDDQAAAFVRGMCREMRRLKEVDGGPDHHLEDPGTMEQIATQFSYEFCKHSVGLETCSVGVGKRAIDLSYEVKSCMKSQPQCIRDRDTCLGTCNGDTGTLTQDFATIAVKQELSVAALGSDVLARSRANCTIQSRVVEVPLFEGGVGFEIYANRLRVRGGMNAIDPRACRREPLACAAVQKVRFTTIRTHECLLTRHTIFHR